jgi:hypothetical protein
MTDDVLFSVPRRKLLAGLGAAAIGGVTASAIGRAAPARAQESKSGGVAPSILAFDVNGSLLDIRHLAPLFERAIRRQQVRERVVYTAHPPLRGNNPGWGALHTIL